MCGKSTGKSCNSISIPNFGRTYNRVIGRIKAFQFGSPDGFSGHVDNIDGIYVDGISITYDSAPRKHVWTYAIGYRQYVINGASTTSTCPSTGGADQPTFVGGNYFCSSGNPGPNWQSVLYTQPLWSNIQGECATDLCGGSNNLFFCAGLPDSTNSNLEVRFCMDEDLSNEDVRIETMDFFIQ